MERLHCRVQLIAPALHHSFVPQNLQHARNSRSALLLGGKLWVHRHCC